MTLNRQQQVRQDGEGGEGETMKGDELIDKESACGYPEANLSDGSERSVFECESRMWRENDSGQRTRGGRGLEGTLTQVR